MLRFVPEAVALAVMVTSAAAQDVSAERAAALSSLVRQDCGSCHGMTLKGGLGRALLPDALGGADKAALAGVILDGIPGTPMPPWRGLITEREALWIADALKEGTIK